ncbi:MAG: glycosyltransferase family 4 protein [Chlamydiia bacterium]|nr:glycosyltransferase family 4 protein [Chlamydiia bacterium]
MHRYPKIAYLISQYPTVSHTFILREVVALKQRGWPLEVASINSPSSQLTELEKQEAGQTFYIKAQGVTGALLSCCHHPLLFCKGLLTALKLAKGDLKKGVYHFFYLIEALILGRWLMKRQIPHLHVHFANPAATVALLLSKLFPITYSLTLHGPDEFHNVAAALLTEKAVSARFISCISHHCLSQVQRITTPSHWDKMGVVPLGVDPDIFSPRPYPPSPFQIVCTGRLVPTKGQIYLLHALERLQQQGLTLTATFIGDGPSRPQLEAFANEHHLNVHFTGNIANTEVHKHLQSAHFFVLPSFSEGVPVSLMEAMAMEIPCIATAINGIPELITDQKEGLLVPPAHLTALTEAIHTLYTDPQRATTLGKAARRKIASQYHLPTNIGTLSSFFESKLRI